MIRRLRIKFIALATGVLILALTAVMGSVVLLLNAQILAQVYTLSELAVESGGIIPLDEEDVDTHVRRHLQMYNPETLYETRYFSVIIDDDGNITSVNDDAIRFVKSDEIMAIAEDIYEKGVDRGTFTRGMNVLAYQASQTEDGNTLIVFIDCSSRYWIVQVVCQYMLLVGGVVTVVFFVLMLIFSKRLIKPYIENDQKQKTFITNASHELKTPLAVISANTEMQEALGGESKWTASTKRQIERMNGLIAAMVTLARADEKGKDKLTKVDFSKIAKDVSESFESLLISQGKQNNHDIDPDIFVKADPKTLAEVVNILEDNAVKYCDDGGLVMTTLRSDKRKKHATLTVSNTYAGHEDIDPDRFFDRFYRADEAHNSKKSGYGIGLSIAKEAVEKMGGRIKAEYLNDTISFTVTMEEV